jgi:hypothetical protein
MIDITAVEGAAYDLSTFLLTGTGFNLAYFDTADGTEYSYDGSNNLVAAWSAESTGDD